MIEGDTALTPDQGTTWGSLTIQLGGMQLRQASAAARQALTRGSSQAKFGADRDSRSTTASISGGGKKVTYGELIGGKSFASRSIRNKPVTDKGPEGLQDRRQADPARRHRGQMHRAFHLHA